MKTICDTNIILRYLLNDDEKLFDKANSIIKHSPYVSLLVMSEVIYVLKNVYKVSKNEIVDSLITLSNDVRFEDNDLFIKSLINYKQNNLDFVDCYLLARNQMLKENVITFDKKLDKKLNKK